MTATLGDLVQDYVAAQCRVLLDSREALAGCDESAVHPARVAIRRLRATLRTFGAVYDHDERERFARELTWLGGVLGDVRDLQVLAERFGADETPPVARQVIADEIERERAAAWPALTAALAGARGEALIETIARWSADPPFGPKALRAADRARKRVRTADADLRTRLAHVRSLASAPPAVAAEALHDARKAAKRHRYAVELAEPVLGSKAAKTIEHRRAIQDALGEHQDAVVALAFLERIAPDQEGPQTADDLRAVIELTRSRVEDVAGVLRETERLQG